MPIERERELQFLEKAYRSGRFEIAVVHKYNDISGPMLIKKFIEGRRAEFLPVNINYAINYDREITGIFKRAERERLILVIEGKDSMNLIESRVHSILCKHIELNRHKTKLFIIISKPGYYYVNKHNMLQSINFFEPGLFTGYFFSRETEENTGS